MPGQTAMKTVENPSLGEVVVEPMLAHLLVLMQRSKKAPVHAFDDPSFRQAPASNTDDPMAIAAHLCDTFGRNAAGSLLKSPLEQMASGLVATAEFAAPFAPEDVIAEATAILSAFYDGLPVPVPSVLFLNSAWARDAIDFIRRQENHALVYLKHYLRNVSILLATLQEFMRSPQVDGIAPGIPAVSQRFIQKRLRPRHDHDFHDGAASWVCNC